MQEGLLMRFCELETAWVAKYSFANIFVIQDYRVIVDMYMPTKQTKKSGVGLSKPARQLSWHQHGTKEQEILQGRNMSFLLAYVCLLRHEAPKIQLSSKARYPVPLPPMLEDVEEEGSSLQHVNDLKYQDYNLLDHVNFPQFQAFHYTCLLILIGLIGGRSQSKGYSWIQTWASEGLAMSTYGWHRMLRSRTPITWCSTTTMINYVRLSIVARALLTRWPTHTTR